MSGSITKAKRGLRPHAKMVGGMVIRGAKKKKKGSKRKGGSMKY